MYANDAFPDGVIIQATGQTDRGSGYLKVPSSVLAIGRCWTVPSMFVFECSQPVGEDARQWAWREILDNGWQHFLGVYTLTELKFCLDQVEARNVKDIRYRWQIPVDCQPKSIAPVSEVSAEQPDLLAHFVEV